MLYYDRIEVYERIYINKTSASKECNICNHCYFLNKGLKFQPYIGNGCLGVMKMSMNLGDIAILNIHGVDYRCIIIGISKIEALDLLQKAESRTLKNIKKLLSNINMGKEILTFGDTEITEIYCCKSLIF